MGLPPDPLRGSLALHRIEIKLKLEKVKAEVIE